MMALQIGDNVMIGNKLCKIVADANGNNSHLQPWVYIAQVIDERERILITKKMLGEVKKL